MIKFDNWRLETCPSAPTIGLQYDHLSRRLEVTGELPEGWDWAMLVRYQGCVSPLDDTILLEPMEGGVGAELTRDNLPVHGYYALQLRGTLRADGVTTRHTNIIQVFVPESLAGHGAWPEVPTEFDQLEQRTRAQADRAEAAASHYPTVGSNGNWQVWDVDAGDYRDTGIYSGGEAPYIGENGYWYVGGQDTGVSANGRPGPRGERGQTGPQGPQGEQGPKGDKGDTGAAGAQGPKGDTGDTGPQGPAGPQGEKGDQGAAGPQGPKGDTGEAGPQGPKGDTGEAGPQGPAGPRGETGTTPQIAVRVTQLAAGAQPTAEVTGTAEAPVIRLGIPRGDTVEPEPKTDAMTQSVGVDEDGKLWTEPGGGEANREWKLLGIVDCSEVSGNIEFTNLDDFSEFWILQNTVKNSSDTASGYDILINDIKIVSAGARIENQKLSGELYRNTHIKFDGLFWLTKVSGGAINNNNVTINTINASFPYNVVKNVGAAKKFKLSSPVLVYVATSGTIEIYGK